VKTEWDYTIDSFNDVITASEHFLISGVVCGGGAKWPH